jgi:hypothetical protein
MQIFIFSTSSAAAICHNEVIVPLSITVCVIQNAFSLFSVSTTSSALLDIALKTLWYGVMDYKAHITLVDSHSKRNRRNDHLNFIPHPP